MRAIIFFLFFAGCSNETVIKKPAAVASFNSNITIRLLACDYQMKCQEDGMCLVKWRCPKVLTDE